MGRRGARRRVRPGGTRRRERGCGDGAEAGGNPVQPGPAGDHQRAGETRDTALFGDAACQQRDDGDEAVGRRGEGLGGGHVGRADGKAGGLRFGEAGGEERCRSAKASKGYQQTSAVSGTYCIHSALFRTSQGARDCCSCHNPEARAFWVTWASDLIGFTEPVWDQATLGAEVLAMNKDCLTVAVGNLIVPAPVAGGRACWMRRSDTST